MRRASHPCSITARVRPIVITADNVKVLSDGNFRVRKNGRESFYTPSMSTTRGTRSRNGKLYGYNEAGDFMELPNR